MNAFGMYSCLIVLRNEPPSNHLTDYVFYLDEDHKMFASFTDQISKRKREKKNALLPFSQLDKNVLRFSKRNYNCIVCF